MPSPTCPYPSDLSDREWKILAPLIPLIPLAKPGGRPRKWPLHKTLNAVFYLSRSGCQWRMLQREFPPWSTVHHYFRRWRLNGTWERLNATLRSDIRVCAGRDPQPSAGILDSQSLKATRVGGVRGYGGAKKLSGRKRHLLVDTLGMVLRVRVHTADVQDRAGVPLLEGADQAFPSLKQLWVDQGYTGTGKAWVEAQLGWRVEVVKHPPKARGVWQLRGELNDPSTVWFKWVRLPPEPKTFRGPLPRRWVVERTISWLAQSRRMSKDYERLCKTSEAMICALMSRLMVRRLAPA